MTSNKNILIGKWEFTKAEQHNGSEWEPSSHVEGMIWEFYPIFFSEKKTIGNIAEFTPTSKQPISLNYTFSNVDNCLRIEVYTDSETRIKDEIDIYEITSVTQTATKKIIVIELINQIGYPPPYFRYILTQTE